MKPIETTGDHGAAAAAMAQAVEARRNESGRRSMDGPAGWRRNAGEIGI